MLSILGKKIELNIKEGLKVENHSVMLSKNQRATITKELKNKTILITGGAGSVGSTLTKEILSYPVKSVRVLDIDEHALFIMKRKIKDKIR